MYKKNIFFLRHSYERARKGILLIGGYGVGNYGDESSVDGGRDWKGDIKNMLLDISKLKCLGWKPKLSSEEAIRKASKELLIR